MTVQDEKDYIRKHLADIEEQMAALRDTAKRWNAESVFTMQNPDGTHPMIQLLHAKSMALLAHKLT